MEPALTSEQWATKKRPGSVAAILPMKEARLSEYSDEDGNWNSLRLVGEAGLVYVSGLDMHAVAALALHNQKFGFTREDVEEIRQAAALAEPFNRELLNLADRIALLLPPE